MNRQAQLYTILATSVLSLAASTRSHAQMVPVQDPAYFITSGSETREVIELDLTEALEGEIPVTQDPAPRRRRRTESRPNATPVSPEKPVVPEASPLDEVEVILDQLIRIGQKIYKIVDAGKPVYNSTVHRTDVVPKGITEWQQLTGWQTPVSKSYEWSLKNLYGMNVITLRYRILFTPGGRYENRGEYLQNVTIIPEYVYVAWGYSLDAVASIPSITNAGSTTNPVAGAELLIDATVKTPLNTARMSASYYVRGDGLFKAL
jgi:hypothetical protein